MTPKPSGDSISDVDRSNGPGTRRRFPIFLLLVATLAALLHMAPFWRAQLLTPEGHEFTGVLSASPDALQYRMLMERSQTTGPIVDNRLTTEPNEPHILMLFYYGVGKLANWLGAPHGFVYEYLGALLAFVLVLYLFRIVDHFSSSRYQTWWVFLTLLIGGGLGGHLLLLNGVESLRGTITFQRIVTDPLRESIMFEQYRNHYIFSTLFDTHFIFFLLLALGAIMALYRAVSSFTWPRVVLASFAFAGATLFHIYDGVTLACVAAGVVFVLWLRKLPVRNALITAAVCWASAGAALLWQLLLYRRSGIPIPDWRADNILFSELALAYALAWGLIVWGLARYWRAAGVRECVLLGWALGCTVLTLSGPFYPYPDRGTLTLQVPLMIVAGAIYFSWRPRVGWKHALLAVAILGAGPLWKTPRRVALVRVEEHRDAGLWSHVWMSRDHQALVTALRANATEEDVLIVSKVRPPWRTDDLWLTSGFRGRLFAGHYAVTPFYARKVEEVNAFFAEGDPEEGPRFLEREGIRFVYVREDQDVTRFEAMPGLRPLQRTPIGTLFEFSPGGPSDRSGAAGQSISGQS